MPLITKYAVKALIVHFLAKVVVCQQCCADSTCDGERGSEVYARYKCVCVCDTSCCVCGAHSLKRTSKLTKTSFQYLHKRKSGIVGIINIRKGVALPLGPVWCWMSEHTRCKENSVMSTFSRHLISSPYASVVAGQATHPILRLSSVIFEPRLIHCHQLE